MKDLVELLYDYNERFIFQGGSEFALKIANEILELRTKAGQWERVFGHLGTADEVGNEWISLKDENEKNKELLSLAFIAHPNLDIDIEYIKDKYGEKL